MFKNEIEENFSWFKSNAKKLVRKYNISTDEVILINHQAYICKFNNYEDAFEFTLNNLSEKDGYILQKITDLDPSYHSLGVLDLHMF
jgi:hypothetical protein